MTVRPSAEPLPMAYFPVKLLERVATPPGLRNQLRHLGRTLSPRQLILVGVVVGLCSRPAHYVAQQFAVGPSLLAPFMPYAAAIASSIGLIGGGIAKGIAPALGAESWAELPGTMQFIVLVVSLPPTVALFGVTTYVAFAVV